MKFQEFTLAEPVKKGISDLGFESPTPVQEQVIPHALEGRDVRACAQTGTGKTCAFVVPILHRLMAQPPEEKPSVLIVVPTRELGAQVLSVVKEVGIHTGVRAVLVMGGADFTRQVKQIRSGAEIIVATPGRLLDHMQRRTFTLKNVNTLVLDEADRMLDMGFWPDIQRIMSLCPPKRQTMLFSATFPPEIVRLTERFLDDPIKIEIAASKPAATVAQLLYPISRSQKEHFLSALLEATHITFALIFCRTKHGADRVAERLQRQGKSVGVIHSNLSQAQRDKALQGFREGRFQLMVATDIASRGLDVKDITHVINYDVPENPEDYVHRVGRTGRADATGDAFTLMAPDEESSMRRIESLIGHPIERAALADFPYLVPPRLTPKVRTVHEQFGRIRRKIPTSRSARFKRR